MFAVFNRGPSVSMSMQKQIRKDFLRMAFSGTAAVMGTATPELEVFGFTRAMAADTGGNSGRPALEMPAGHVMHGNCRITGASMPIGPEEELSHQDEHPDDGEGTDERGRAYMSVETGAAEQSYPFMFHTYFIEMKTLDVCTPLTRGIDHVLHSRLHGSRRTARIGPRRHRVRRLGHLLRVHGATGDR
ncbi:MULTISPECIES: hypothetical protein [Streptomyces]|uniref:hypothetical protein n=1 Tax=Streptomyces TaxID=1883 RepID=UPI001F2392EA|nr:MULTISPECIES: hypothetical protein [Streptomyces]